MTATTQMHFNPRSHEGSDANARERARRQNISIHAPTRGATIKKLPKRDQSSDFNPRSHEGSDIEEGVGVGVTSDFNPRSHEGSDDVKPWVDGWSDTFQSTLPRGERHIIHQHLNYIKEISIHAPTRGATIVGTVHDSILGISIHAPTRGATQILMVLLFTSKFQSTLPRGERLFHQSSISLSLYISIHAPTRGATNLLL